MTTPVPVSRPALTGDVLMIEACLCALAGMNVDAIAHVLHTGAQTVADALKKSGGWFVVYRRSGMRTKTFWFFPEADRKRIGMDWQRCVMTGAEMLIYGDYKHTPVDRSTIVPGDMRVTSWQREMPPGKPSRRWRWPEGSPRGL